MNTIFYYFYFYKDMCVILLSYYFIISIVFTVCLSIATMPPCVHPFQVIAGRGGLGVEVILGRSDVITLTQFEDE